MEKTHLACYEVREDGSDGCRVCFRAHEYAIGENATRLDGSLLRITEVFLPDSTYRRMRVVYQRNGGEAYAEIVKSLQSLHLQKRRGGQTERIINEFK